jgi:chemotaxis protein MotB
MEAEEECKCPPPGAPAWMSTFADLMSLLMCFFVLLLSFSEMDVLKFKQIAGSMKYAFGVQNVIKVIDIPKGTSIIAQEFSPGRPEPTPIEMITQQTIEITKAKLDFQDGDSSRVGGKDNVKVRKTDSKIEDEATEDVPTETLDSASADAKQEEAPTQEKEQSDTQVKLTDQTPSPGVSAQQGLAKKIAEDLRDEIEDGAIEIESLGQQLIIRIREKGAFPSGSAFLQPRFRPVIAKVATILVDIPGIITISGHTDNEPVQSELYRSNWDLSAQRAVSVAHEMIKVKGMSEKDMSVVGYANSKPLTEGDTNLDHNRNRRVEISIMQGEAAESGEVSTDYNAEDQ